MNGRTRGSAPQGNKREWLLGAFLLAAALYFAFYFDKQIIVFFSQLRNIYLSQIFLGIKFLDSWFFVIVFVTLLLVFNKKRREWVILSWITLGAVAVITFILKIIIHRTRPFAEGVVSILPQLTPNSLYLIKDFSFPSFDAAFAFCAIPIISKFYPKLKYLWLVFASLVLLSRVYFGVHYLSDVISGAAIGLLIGLIILKFEEKNKFFKKVYKRIFKKK